MRVLVLGAAVSGRAALRLLESEGHTVVVHDADPGAVTDLGGGRVAVGGEWDRRLLEGIDLVVPSPGIPEHADPIRDALGAGIDVVSELELGASRLAAPYAAVTATNGKTTVTRIAAEMLSASGMEAAAVGNIGDPLCDAVGRPWEALVIEASSFQLRFIDGFHPRAAVLLNVAPDHLDWHGTFEAYRDAKARIHRNQGPDDLLVYDEDDEGALDAVRGAAARLVPVSGRHRAAGGGPEGGMLWMGEVGVATGALAVDDPAYLADLAAAGVVALAMGASREAVAESARGFSPGRHRREVIGTWGGVAWVDDSKATNPHAALAAVRAYPSVVLIAGGRNKGLDVAPVALDPAVRHVITLGEEGPAILAAARRGSPAADMAEAVVIADGIAEPGDTVLLAPGCASFDMYHSYGERGDHFASLVRARKGT
ncbi:MAG: UDP-N-acetylmuramoyl-L-alanine--D-glutamate ligase [Actinobacteria bacterium]|nr:UDP-N-acetylmuramoyl-L-alanine--D-glutamate ligase [Actinomycetota bacterium]MBU1494339.1 UDP-N-acetylmuramoyl-L-alanine--D-glutamate ligase [Actinomycetota bacterium]